ncbi:MAG TPA: type II secretion system protein [bacterium]|nr:type II secretion system protein [bacterium]
MRNKKGFTLIELLVVIAIIGLLSTLAVVSLNGARQKARDAVRKSDLNAIATAMELYKTESGNDQYYATVGACATPANLATKATDGDLCEGNAIGTYMTSIPGDPSTDQEYTYTGDADGYTITADLESTASSFVCTNGSCKEVAD